MVKDVARGWGVRQGAVVGARIGASAAKNRNVRRWDDCKRKKFYMNRVRRSPPRGPSLAGLPMSDAPFRSVRALKRDVSADGEPGLLHTLIGLRPYIWPADRNDLKLRIWIS